MTGDSLLAALLDAIIPADGDLPGAGTLGLGALARADAEDGAFGVGLHRLLGALPADFGILDQDTREAALREIECVDPSAMADAVNLVYTAYYTSATVLSAVEERTGYHAEPPQPRGYRLDPFDPKRLPGGRDSTTTWRRT